MSELPQIDPSKVLQKTVGKLEQELSASRTRESHLEALAEALRDERDEARSEVSNLTERLNSLSQPVPDITSLPTN